MYTESLVKQCKVQHLTSRIINIIGTVVVASVLTVGLLIFLGRVPSAAHSLADNTPDWTADGETNSSFGNAVTDVGDVNGDGYSDAIIGAHRYGGDQGRVYVYLGSAGGPAATPVLTLTGENAEDRFGDAVGIAGDVNGDGYSDVVIGARRYNDWQGRVYVYLGSKDGLVATPALTLTGETVGDRFGSAVGSMGDVNGDGYSDVIVGAPNYYGLRGRAYLYLGGAEGLSSLPAFSPIGENVENYFGSAVGSAGDVNGDGYSDILIGAHGYGSNQGRVYLHLGGAAGIATIPAITLNGENADDYFGAALGRAGDVNGDGYGDTIISAWGYNNNRGQTYVYLGSAEGMAQDPTAILTGENPDDRFGSAVGGAGDVDGDGYGDVIIGAYRYGTDQGRVYVYLGSAEEVASLALLTLTGENPNDQFGYSVGGIGDVNGDGYHDVIVGARGYTDGQGRTYVYYGAAAATPAAAPSVTFTGEDTGDRFGIAVEGVGDVNGDGYTDALVGAWGRSGNQGWAYLYLGGAEGLAVTPSITLTGEDVGDRFGTAVGGAGDVNGDSYGDVLVGAEHYNNDRGRTYVYLGSGGGLVATPTFTLTGENTGDHFGVAVGSAGDVNGDGYGDVLVGAENYGSGQGRAYVYLGSAGGLDVTPTFTLTGENAGEHFGIAVRGAGDVNGDGYGDVLVGAWGYNNWQGRVYLYLGSAEGLSTTPDLILTGETTYNWFGAVLGGAGDMNGDGYSDVLIGARGYSNQQGRAYVYLGGAEGLDEDPVRILTGENTGDRFGAVVGGTGDVNGDGYSDAIIGAANHNNYQGKAYLYLGGEGGLSALPARTFTGENPGDYFGAAVGGAGDVSGDGYSDVLIGAYGYNSSQGRAYAYYGNTGAGRVVLPRQGSAPSGTLVLPWEAVRVQPWGLALSQDSFRVTMRATSPRGREQVKLQVQACPPGVPFPHSSCFMHTAVTWTDVTATSQGVTLTTSITDLHPGILYRWRARVLYATYSSAMPDIVPPPHPASGPWRRLYAQSSEGDVRTDPRLGNNAPTANAGDDQTVQADAIVTLDGSGSYDLDDDGLAYGWMQVGGPEVTFNPHISITIFTAPPSSATLTFTLAITDVAIGTTNLPGTSDDVIITVKDNIYIYLPLVLRNP